MAVMKKRKLRFCWSFSLLISTICLAQTLTQPPVVTLGVLVLDRTRRSVTDVRQEELQLSVDGVPQTISFFGKDELPVSYGLVIDNSNSLEKQLNSVKEASKIIVSKIRPKDQAFLVRFIYSNQITKLVEMTSDHSVLLEGLNLMRPEMGQTALIDAAYVSADYISKFKSDDGSNRRRVLILITDGEDRASFYTRDKLLQLLQKSGVEIYAIGLIKELSPEGGLVRKSPRVVAIDLLERLAKDTGGQAFFLKSESELPRVVDEMMSNLYSRYLVSYVPTESVRGKDQNKARVKIANRAGGGKFTVSTRILNTDLKGKSNQ
jgi:Ca-activated chloride channel family protein